MTPLPPGPLCPRLGPELLATLQGLDPSEAKFIGVKNPMNFRLGYAKYTDPEANNIVCSTPHSCPSMSNFINVTCRPV